MYKNCFTKEELEFIRKFCISTFSDPYDKDAKLATSVFMKIRDR